MDFGSIVESLSSGPFNWAGGSVSSAYAHNCCDKNHYHRHCTCAIHSIDSGFKGSPTCSPSNTVKVAGGGGSFSGNRICRSISVQNLGDKKFLSGNLSCGNSYSEDDSMSPATGFGSLRNSFSSSFSSLSQLGVGDDDELSVETLSLVEELASFINLIKDKDSAGCNSGQDDYEIESNGSVFPAIEDGSPSFPFTGLPILVPGLLRGSRSPNGLVSTTKFAPDHSRPHRLSLLERKLSTQLSVFEHPVLSGHTKRSPYGR